MHLSFPSAKCLEAGGEGFRGEPCQTSADWECFIAWEPAQRDDELTREAAAPPASGSSAVVVVPPAASTAGEPITPGKVDHLTQEIALLRRINDDLRVGDGSAALAKIDQHERTFGGGALVEEREAARVLALCAAKHPIEAERYARAFQARYPHSPSAPRLRASCASWVP